MRESSHSDGLDRLDALARDSSLLGSSLCLTCADHRTIQSGKGSLFLLCQSQSTPDAWPKYPPQPLQRCPFHRNLSLPTLGEDDVGDANENGEASSTRTNLANGGRE